MIFKKSDELLLMTIKKENCFFKEKKWCKLKKTNFIVHCLCTLDYDETTPILTQDLNSIFNYHLVKSCTIKVKEMFRVENNIKHPYENQQLNVLYSIDVQDILDELIEEKLNKKNIYLGSRTEKVDDLSYIYMEDDRLMFLWERTKYTDILEPILLHNKNFTQVQWKVLNYHIKDRDNISVILSSLV